jgi:hypothetical protein
VESESLYSLDNLIQLANGRLLAEIESIVQKFHRHITQECEICRGNAFFCELCAANEVDLFTKTKRNAKNIK